MKRPLSDPIMILILVYRNLHAALIVEDIDGEMKKQHNLREKT